jgi:hypothetical protein
MNDWYGGSTKGENVDEKRRMFWDVGWGYGEVFYGPIYGA